MPASKPSGKPSKSVREGVALLQGNLERSGARREKVDFLNLAPPASETAPGAATARASQSSSERTSQIADVFLQQISPSIASNNPQAPSLPTNLIPIELIDDNPWQPRVAGNTGLSADSVAKLAESVSSVVGLNNPITVRRTSNGRYQLISGARRLAAFRLLRRTAIPAIVRDLDDWQSAALAFEDNEARTDLTDYEVARYIQRLEDQFENLTATEIARLVGRHRRAIYKLKHYLALPEAVQRLLDARPDLISYNYAEKFALALAQGLDEPSFVEAVELLARGEIVQDRVIERAALKAARRDGALRAASECKTALSPAKAAIAEIKLQGRKLTVSLAKELSHDDARAIQSVIHAAIEQHAARLEPVRSDDSPTPP